MHTLGEMMVPEGYRHYARSEGLDPSSYFQMVKQQPSLPNNQGLKSAGGGYGSSILQFARLFWRLFSPKLRKISLVPSFKGPKLTEQTGSSLVPMIETYQSTKR